MCLCLLCIMLAPHTSTVVIVFSNFSIIENTFTKSFCFFNFICIFAVSVVSFAVFTSQCQDKRILQLGKNLSNLPLLKPL